MAVSRINKTRDYTVMSNAITERYAAVPETRLYL